MTDDDKILRTHFGVWFPLVKFGMYVVAVALAGAVFGLGCGAFVGAFCCAFSAVAP